MIPRVSPSIYSIALQNFLSRLNDKYIFTIIFFLQINARTVITRQRREVDFLENWNSFIVFQSSNKSCGKLDSNLLHLGFESVV